MHTLFISRFICIPLAHGKICKHHPFIHLFSLYESLSLVSYFYLFHYSSIHSSEPSIKTSVYLSTLSFFYISLSVCSTHRAIHQSFSVLSIYSVQNHLFTHPSTSPLCVFLFMYSTHHLFAILSYVFPSISSNN